MAECFATRSLTSADATTRLASKISTVLIAGDILLLNGPLGAGKSHFARAVIHDQLGSDEDVPSPTFTLVQVYETPNFDIWHCDLYRLSDPDAAIELGLDEAFETAACLIEWPSRLGAFIPKKAVTLQLEIGMEEGSRIAHFHGAPSPFRSRLETLFNV